MFNLEKKFVLERLSLGRRRNGYCDTMVDLSMGISDEIEVATIVVDETIKSGNRECSLPADVLWGSFVTHSFRMRDKRTPKDVCGEATVSDAMMAKASAKKSETFRVFLLLFKPVAFYFLVSFVVLMVAQARL